MFVFFGVGSRTLRKVKGDVEVTTFIIMTEMNGN